MFGFVIFGAKILYENLDEIDTWGQFHQHVYSKLSLEDPKSIKRQSSLKCLFALLGHLLAKVSCKHVGEICP